MPVCAVPADFEGHEVAAARVKDASGEACFDFGMLDGDIEEREVVPCIDGMDLVAHTLAEAGVGTHRLEEDGWDDLSILVDMARRPEFAAHMCAAGMPDDETVRLAAFLCEHADRLLMSYV